MKDGAFQIKQQKWTQKIIDCVKEQQEILYDQSTGCALQRHFRGRIGWEQVRHKNLNFVWHFCEQKST